MKKILILMLAALMLFSCAAQARTPQQMQIINCEEWVSLRLQPDPASDRAAQVPLGEDVRGFYASHGAFSYCEFDGRTGYILNEYLQAGEQGGEVHLPGGDPAFRIDLENGSSLRAWYGFTSVGEVLRLGCYTEGDTLLWAYATETLASGELTGVTAFVNERAQRPMVMVYNADVGLIALDAATGEEIWTLTDGEVSLGGSITHAVANDGFMYIGGYYGPDPACISPDGDLLWQARQDKDTDFCWLDDIVILSDGIAVHYDNCGEPVWAGYDLKGKMISWDPDPA